MAPIERTAMLPSELGASARTDGSLDRTPPCVLARPTPWGRMEAELKSLLGGRSGAPHANAVFPLHGAIRVARIGRHLPQIILEARSALHTKVVVVSRHPEVHAVDAIG
jgi:hypothetical protein